MMIDGIRGCAASFVRASSWGMQSNYIKKAQNDLLVMVQVETPQGVDAIPEIAQVPGIDGIFLGPLDLSCSLGKLGQFNDAEFQALISRAEQAVVKESSGCFLAGFRYPGREVLEMFQSGYSLVCGAVDLGLLREAAKADAKVGQDALDQFHERT